MRIVRGGQHVQAIRGGIQLPPEEILFDLCALRNHEHSRIEGRDFFGRESSIEVCGEEACRYGYDFLEVAIEPEWGGFLFEISQEEGVFVALSVGEAATDHLLAESQGGLVQGVG